MGVHLFLLTFCVHVLPLLTYFVAEEKSSPAKGTPKKMKVEAYKLTKEQKAWIKGDESNRKLWGEAMESLALGPVRKSSPDFTPLELNLPLSR